MTLEIIHFNSYYFTACVHFEETVCMGCQDYVFKSLMSENVHDFVGGTF